MQKSLVMQKDSIRKQSNRANLSSLIGIDLFSRTYSTDYVVVIFLTLSTHTMFDQFEVLYDFVVHCAAAWKTQ